MQGPLIILFIILLIVSIKKSPSKNAITPLKCPAFCFIVKDGAKYLEQNLNRIIHFAKRFPSWKIFYVENDSSDKTIQILETFTKIHKNITGKNLRLEDGKHSTELCDDPGKPNCPKRTRRLAFLRQECLKMVLLEKQCTEMVMMDMDFVDFDPEELSNMFKIFSQQKIDGIFGMSITTNGCPYDTGALNPRDITLEKIKNGDKIITVKSAFSGFGIYSMDAIRSNKAKYNSRETKIEHHYFNGHFRNLKLYSNFKPIYAGPCYSSHRF